MTRYTADSKDRVRDAVDMVALVSARTELRRAGVNSYFGICPFHEERTGSFHVSPDERLYHCFGCQASGDAFKFVMETEGLDFTSALESLAQRAPVKIACDIELPTRPPASVEAVAYFVVAEALTNVLKYANTDHAAIRAHYDGDDLVVEMKDDGVGGAEAGHGTGLQGLRDRVGALDGTLDVVSPAGAGTLVRARIPCGPRSAITAP